MAWSTPLTAVSNATLTAAQWNASVRDNLLETAAARATTAGRIFVSTGVNTLAERQVGIASVIASEPTTTVGTPGDLATPGPAVTLTTGTTVIVILSSLIFNNTVAGTGQMALVVSGATTIAAAPENSMYYRSSAASDLAQMSYAFPLTVNAGSNTFTAKYAVSAGTGTFGRRRLIVLPFG